MGQPTDQYFSTTLEKGLSILRLFDRDHTRLTLTQITGLCGLNKTTAYRLVNTLVSLGYLSKNPKSKVLRLGFNALVLGKEVYCVVDTDSYAHAGAECRCHLKRQPQESHQSEVGQRGD